MQRIILKTSWRNADYFMKMGGLSDFGFKWFKYFEVIVVRKLCKLEAGNFII